MRHVIFATAVATALASCATTGTNTAVTAASIQSAAVAACNFLPDASTIANILTASPIAATAEGIAAIICSAVTGQPAAAVKRRASAPTVFINGRAIAVTGHFVAAQARRAQ